MLRGCPYTLPPRPNYFIPRERRSNPKRSHATGEATLTAAGSQHATNGFIELGRSTRLDEVQIEARFSGPTTMIVAIESRDGDQLRVAERAIGTYPLSHGVTIEPRHGDIEQHQVWVKGAGFLEGTLTVKGGANFKTPTRKHDGESIGSIAIVISDQDANVSSVRCRRSHLRTLLSHLDSLGETTVSLAMHITRQRSVAVYAGRLLHGKFAKFAGHSWSMLLVEPRARLCMPRDGHACKQVIDMPATGRLSAMNVNLFTWIREGVRQAVLHGVHDAVGQIGTNSDSDDMSKRLLDLIRQSDNALAVAPVAAMPSGRGRKLGRSLEQIVSSKND